MKKILLLILLLVSFVTTVFAQPTTKRVAILDVVDKEGMVTYGVRLQLRSSLIYAINHTPGYDAVERVDLPSIMDEQKFQRSGLVSVEQIKEIGRMNGAAYVLVAEAAVYDENNILVAAKLLDVVTGRIVESADPQTAPKIPDEMKHACVELARSLLKQSQKYSREKIFHNRLKTDIQQKGTLVYAQSSDESQDCDGKYDSPVEYFNVNLNGLTREHFCLIFRFWAWSNKGKLWHTTDQNTLVLSHGSRILEILLKEDGYIYITTNNHEHEYSTGLSYKEREGKLIELEYDNGLITINGVTFEVEMDEYHGDNVLSSINYSNGNAFWGNISSVQVYNLR